MNAVARPERVADFQAEAHQPLEVGQGDGRHGRGKRQTEANPKNHDAEEDADLDERSPRRLRASER